MTKAYDVAGHVFHLTLSDGSPVWSGLAQYDPFECRLSDSPVFELHMSADWDEDGFEKVYDPPVEPGQTVIRLFRRGDEWMGEMSPEEHHGTCARFLASGGFSHAALKLVSRKPSDVIFSINNTLMLLYAFCTADKMTLEMHASVIRNDGRGYLFLGKSGTGKSTHSRQWLKYIDGSRLLNDDNPIVRVHDDGSVRVYGSPWSGKTPCYVRDDCPVGAFVRIRQSPQNVISRMGLVESYASVYSSSSGFKAERDMADAIHNTLEAVVTTVPCFLLDCRPDEEAAQVCAAKVRNYEGDGEDE